MAEDILSYLNYTQMMDQTRELLDSDKWHIEITQWPTVVYDPGATFLHTHVKSVSGLNLSDFHTEPLKTKIRGFETFVQPNQTPLKNKEVTWTLIDYEDQSIYVLMQDWEGKSCDPTTQRSYRAADLRGTFKYQRLNSVNLTVREWVHAGCMPSKVDYKDNFDSERKLVGDDVTLIMTGILFPPTLKNLSAI